MSNLKLKIFWKNNTQAKVISIFDGIYYTWVYKKQPNFSWTNKKNKQSTNIKHDEINIMNIINDNTFNMHNSLLNNDNRYMKITLKSKLIGVSRWLISANCVYF